MDPTERSAFKAAVGLDDHTWDRARGWALWKALHHLDIDQAEPALSRADKRMGWRLPAHGVIAEVIADHRQL